MEPEGSVRHGPLAARLSDGKSESICDRRKLPFPSRLRPNVIPSFPSCTWERNRHSSFVIPNMTGGWMRLLELPPAARADVRKALASSRQGEYPASNSHREDRAHANTHFETP